jgi:hypothetical protein
LPVCAKLILFPNTDKPEPKIFKSWIEIKSLNTQCQHGFAETHNNLVRKTHTFSCGKGPNCNLGPEMIRAPTGRFLMENAGPGWAFGPIHKRPEENRVVMRPALSPQKFTESELNYRTSRTGHAL